MADVYPVPCDQVARPLPAPGTDVGIRNKRETETAVAALGLPGFLASLLGSLLPSRYRTVKGLLESAGCLGFEGPQKPSVVVPDDC